MKKSVGIFGYFDIFRKLKFRRESEFQANSFDFNQIFRFGESLLTSRLHYILSLSDYFRTFGSSDPKLLSPKSILEAQQFDPKLERYQIICGYQILLGISLFAIYLVTDCRYPTIMGNGRGFF